MRTNFNTEDVKNIVEEIFNGNLRAYKASKGAILYENPNSEKILMKDEIDGTSQTADLAEYLDIHFYNWKERLNEKQQGNLFESWGGNFDEWVASLNFSMNETYALVKRLDEEVTPSQDIDNATIIGRITFLVQANKINNLDYYVSKIRNAYLGVPQDIQNAFGDVIKAYIMLGGLNYDQEPITTQLGEVVVVTSNFRISYLTDALSWTDTKIEISLDGDDTYDENGQVVGETKYMEMPITKASFQNIMTSNPVPTVTRPDLTGFVVASISNAKTFTFFDFNKKLSLKFNDLFWSISAVRINGVATTTKDVNIPVYIRITCPDEDGEQKTYVYKDVIDNMQKSMTNSDFNVSSITTKGWGKIQ